MSLKGEPERIPYHAPPADLPEGASFRISINDLITYLQASADAPNDHPEDNERVAQIQRYLSVMQRHYHPERNFAARFIQDFDKLSSDNAAALQSFDTAPSDLQASGGGPASPASAASPAKSDSSATSDDSDDFGSLSLANERAHAAGTKGHGELARQWHH